MNTLSQISAITLMNLKNIPSRLVASMVVVVGIAGVVTVLVALLAMAKGFEATLQGTGQTDRAIVMRGGATVEMNSAIDPRRAAHIKTKPGLAKTKHVLAAGETYVIADVKKRANDSDANLPMRGVEKASFEIRDEVHIVEGRNIEFGKFEMIAGVKAADQFQGLEVGRTLTMRGADWKLVGLFESGGSVHESEVWVDNVTLAANLGRGGSFSSMLVRLQSELDLGVFRKSVEDDPRLEHKVVSETEYYSEQSSSVTSLITTFGYGVAVIMAIGAVFAALNTMYSAVSARSVEIATLRALGFGSTPMVVSVMVEALTLSIFGGLLGGLIAYVFFNGYTASTMGATFSQVSFSFAVTTELLTRGIIWSCVLGLIGGLFPSISAARQPVTVALRGL